MNARNVLFVLVSFLALGLTSLEIAHSTVMHLKVPPFGSRCLYADILAIGEKFVFFYTVSYFWPFLEFLS